MLRRKYFGVRSLHRLLTYRISSIILIVMYGFMVHNFRGGSHIVLVIVDICDVSFLLKMIGLIDLIHVAGIFLEWKVL